MRAAPPIAFTVSRFGVWHAALAVLCALGTAAMGLWWAAADRPRPLALTLAAAAGVVLAVALPLAEAWAARPLSLRWDGGRWHLARHCRPAAEPLAGHVSVAIDLGGWMLLRFVAGRDHLAARRLVSRTSWVPLQRRGLEREWHAIRSTLYAPHSTTAPAEGSAGRPIG